MWVWVRMKDLVFFLILLKYKLHHCKPSQVVSSPKNLKSLLKIPSFEEIIETCEENLKKEERLVNYTRRSYVKLRNQGYPYDTRGNGIGPPELNLPWTQSGPQRLWRLQLKKACDYDPAMTFDDDLKEDAEAIAGAAANAVGKFKNFFK